MVHQIIERKQNHMVRHVNPQLITRKNNITWCTWHMSMHHDQIMESYPQFTPLNNYLSNCVIKLFIKLQNHQTNVIQDHPSNTDVVVVFHKCHTCWLCFFNKARLKMDVELLGGSHGLDIVIKPRGWVRDKWSSRLTCSCILFISNWG